MTNRLRELKILYAPAVQAFSAQHPARRVHSLLEAGATGCFLFAICRVPDQVTSGIVQAVVVGGDAREVVMSGVVEGGDVG